MGGAGDTEPKASPARMTVQANKTIPCMKYDNLWESQRACRGYVEDQVESGLRFLVDERQHTVVLNVMSDIWMDLLTGRGLTGGPASISCAEEVLNEMIQDLRETRELQAARRGEDTDSDSPGEPGDTDTTASELPAGSTPNGLEATTPKEPEGERTKPPTAKQLWEL
jgi:hypothetical protein